MQLCGDAHLSNFGVFASPERRLVFDVNDFDETLPGPFEYDVKRLASSFAVAARHNGFAKRDRSAVTRGCVRAYRKAISAFAGMRTLDAWYASKSEEELRSAARAMAKGAEGAKALKRAERNLAKARGRDSLQALSKLAAVVGGEYRIVSRPPAVIRLEELAASQGRSPDGGGAAGPPSTSPPTWTRCRTTGGRCSNGSRSSTSLARSSAWAASAPVPSSCCFKAATAVTLCSCRRRRPPASVLEGHLPASRYAGPGERVVQGQRLMQSVSDVFLGWSDGSTGRDYYFRQLRDMKGSALVESMAPGAMGFYADLCGWTLARAHARSGDAVAIDAYLGDSDEFEDAVTEFARRYAKQNQRDYEAFLAAIERRQAGGEDGRVRRDDRDQSSSRSIPTSQALASSSSSVSKTFISPGTSHPKALTACSSQSASETTATRSQPLRFFAHSLVSAQAAPRENESNSSPRM